MATTNRLVSSPFVNRLVTNPVVFRLLFTSFVTKRFASQTRLLGGDDWLFFNYGYEEDPPMALPLAASDEPHRFFIQLYHRTATQVDLKGKKVLEVSCGHGGGASYLVRTLGPASYTGLDLNSGGVESCRKRHQLPGLDFVQGNAEKLLFADESFDAVINVEASHCTLTSPVSSPKWHACCAREGIFCTPISAAARVSLIGRRRLPTHRCGCFRVSSLMSRLSAGWGTIRSGCWTSSVAACQIWGFCTA